MQFQNSSKITPAAVALATLLTAGSAMAQSASLRTDTFSQPTLDRWFYPFGGTPGAEISASVFRTPSDATVNGVAAFDDRDAQLVVAFDTAPLIQKMRGPNCYRLTSLRLTLTTSNPPRFAYDPSYDNPLVADTDPGTPVEVFGAGYRNGFNATTITEGMPFAFAAPYTEGVRNIFAAQLNADGSVQRDISNQIRDGFEAPPMAIGQVAGLTPGDLVPQASTMTFDLDLTQPSVKKYLQNAFDQGRLVLVVSSLHLAAGGPGGGGEPNYPAFYTKENPIQQSIQVAAKLDVTMNLSVNIDFNNDDSVFDPMDIDAFLSVYSEGPCLPAGAECGDIDFNNDTGLFDPMDINDFLSVYSEGPCSTGNC
ncbi:MAG: hypothetical protein U0640_07585 [Phycisphaerales bacterium]